MAIYQLLLLKEMYSFFKVSSIEQLLHPKPSKKNSCWATIRGNKVRKIAKNVNLSTRGYFINLMVDLTSLQRSGIFIRINGSLAGFFQGDPIF